MTLNWRDLNKKLPKLTEKEVHKLLVDEMDGARRVTVVIRLHQRFTALRATRERGELLEDVVSADMEDATAGPVH